MEYDKNIGEHCQIKTIFHRGLHCPTQSLSCIESVRNPCGRTSVSIRGRKRRKCTFFEWLLFACVGGLPKICSTVTCCAASKMPRIEKIRLEYQKAEASQYASPIAFQEKEPMVAAAKMALLTNDNVSTKKMFYSDFKMANAQMDKGDLQQWKRIVIPQACGSTSDPDDKRLYQFFQAVRCKLR